MLLFGNQVILDFCSFHVSLRAKISVFFSKSSHQECSPIFLVHRSCICLNDTLSQSPQFSNLIINRYLSAACFVVSLVSFVNIESTNTAKKTRSGISKQVSLNFSLQINLYVSIFSFHGEEKPLGLYVFVFAQKIHGYS